MYLSVLMIIIAAAVFYLWGYSKGNQKGREDMQELLVADPDLYGRLKYADDESKQPLDDD